MSASRDVKQLHLAALDRPQQRLELLGHPRVQHVLEMEQPVHDVHPRPSSQTASSW